MPTAPRLDRDVLTLAWLARVLEGARTELTLPQYRLLALMRSDGLVQGAPVVVESLETVQFHDDGSVHWKTYFDIPEGSEYGEWTSQTGE